MRTPITLVLAVLIPTTLIFNGCSSSTTDKTKDEEVEESRELNFSDITKRYNAIRGWDTVINIFSNYTIEYQNLFSDTNQLYSLEGMISIEDIYKRNNKIFISGTLYGLFSIYYFKLECPPTQVERILEYSNNKSFGGLCLIAKIDDVKNLNVEISSMVEEEFSAYIELDWGQNILLTGYLIDFYFDEN